MFANRSGKFSYDLHCGVGMPQIDIVVDGKPLVTISDLKCVKPKTLAGQYWEFDGRREEDLIGFGNFPSTPVKHKKPKCVKVGNVEFQKKFGVTPTLAAKIVNGIIYSTCIKPYLVYQNIFRQGKGRNYIPYAFRNVVKNFDMLEQARVDGIMHVTPLIALFGKNPQDLKKLVGKAEWKKLASNTFGRNLKIAHAAYQMLNRQFCQNDRVDEKTRSVLIDLNKCRTTLLSSPRYVIPMNWLAKQTKLPMKKILEQNYEHRKAIDVYEDTRHMARELDLPFNQEWSVRKMEEKHGEYSTAFRDKTEADRRNRDANYRKQIEEMERIDISSVFTQTVWKEGDTVAVILTKHKDVRDEGSVMSHCVGGYADRVINGDYIVVSMVSGNGDRSTLGLLVTGFVSKDVSFSQHYGRYNERVKNEEHLKLAETVLQSLQQMNLTKEKYDEAKTR